MAPPTKKTDYVFYTSLTSQASPPNFQANPTLATGDAKVSTDGGAFGNLATLPAVTPASGRAVKVSLSAAEMNGEDIIVQLVDVTGAEWGEKIIHIQTGSVTLANAQGVAKNTAYSNFLFVMYDTSGVATTGLTITATRSLDGAAFAACANSATELTSGTYAINLDATDLNADEVMLRFAATGAADTFIKIKTVQV